MSGSLSIRRILTTVALGFPVVLALAWASAGCVTVNVDDDNDHVGVVIPPPMQPDHPQQPDDPPPWCGLESTVEQAPSPIFPEDWMQGQPFELSDGGGYIESFDQVNDGTHWKGLTLHIFQDGQFRRDYSISSVLVTPMYSGCWYGVNDVAVDDPLVFVLFQMSCWYPNGMPAFQVSRLATVDVDFGLTGWSGVWPIEQESEVNYQLASDGENLFIGTYHPFSAQLGFRPLRWSGGQAQVGDEQIVRSGENSGWERQWFVSFDVDPDGIFTYQLSNPNNAQVETTLFRECN